MEVGNKSIYNGQFRGNILVVGKTGYGKTYLLQKLGLNKCFDKLVKTEWVTGIEIDEQRESEIQSCFSNKVEFHLATEPDEVVSLLEKFKLRSRDITNNENNSIFRENFSIGCIFVMDDVSGIAENCQELAEILTVSRKYRYHCIYVFRIIAPESQIWKKILSQSNIFNIFPSSMRYDMVAKFFQSNCRQITKKYVPARSVWLNMVFADLAKTHERHCLTIDCSGVNKNGLGRYRTQADDPVKQVCYLNKPRDDELYIAFRSNMKKVYNFSSSIYFNIDRVQGKEETFDAEKTLQQDGADDRFSKFDTDPEPTAEFHGKGRKREHGETSEHTNGRTRKSARVRFLSGR